MWRMLRCPEGCVSVDVPTFTTMRILYTSGKPRNSFPANKNRYKARYHAYEKIYTYYTIVPSKLQWEICKKIQMFLRFIGIKCPAVPSHSHRFVDLLDFTKMFRAKPR